FTLGVCFDVLVSPLLFSTFSSFPYLSYTFISYSILLFDFIVSWVSYVISSPLVTLLTSSLFKLYFVSFIFSSIVYIPFTTSSCMSFSIFKFVNCIFLENISPSSKFSFIFINISNFFVCIVSFIIFSFCFFFFSYYFFIYY